jgi:hypothetical protein
VNTEELIAELARTARPVAPLANPFARVARWAAAFAVFAAIVVLALGARPTIADDVSRPAFLALASITIATAWLAAAAAVRSSVPGIEGNAAERALPLAGAAAWAAMLIAMIAAGGNAPTRIAAFPIHAGCIVNIAAIGLLPGWTLLTMVRRAAPLNPLRSATLAALAGLTLAAAAVQFICPIDDPAHHLDGHLLPALAFTAIGAILGTRWLESKSDVRS